MFRGGEKSVGDDCGSANGAGVECACFVGASFWVEVRLPWELAELSVVSSYDTVGCLVDSAGDTWDDVESVGGGGHRCCCGGGGGGFGDTVGLKSNLKNEPQNWVFSRTRPL